MVLFVRLAMFAVLVLTASAGFSQPRSDVSPEDAKRLIATADYKEIDRLVTKENVDKLFIDGESLLTKAIEKNDRRLLDLLLAKGADLNLRNEDFYGSTPLMACSGYDNIGFARILLEKGANVNQTDKSGDSAIHWSAYSGQIALTELFLDFGARVDIKSKHADGAMEIALKEYQNSISDLLIYRGKAARKIDPDARRLIFDIKSNDLERVAARLGKFDVNQLDEAGTPILTLAAERGFDAIVRFLIQNKADVNAMNAVGHTAVNRAVFFGRDSTVDILIAGKADVNLTDKKFVLTPLMAAARKNRDAIGEKLVKNGANINQTNAIDNFSPLLWAVYGDNFEFVRMILKYNPDLTIVSKYDTDVFKVAKGKVKELLEEHRRPKD